MPRGGLIKAAALCCSLALLFAASAAGEGALVIVNDIVLRADGGFRPRELPRQRFAPIDFQGRFDISAKGGGKPVALEEVAVDFDRDGRLGVVGLPVCPPERVAVAGPAEARRACPGAIVGTGHLEAQIGLPEGTVVARSALTLFNGPRQEGDPSVVLHARTTVPVPQTFAIVIPIQRRPGEFRYRARLALPPIAGGLGAVTHVDVEVGRRFSAGGRTFADGTVVDGSVEKPCRPR
jgi:hypothetical protein